MPGIDRFAAEPLQLNLAVSLHAATDELRDRLVPLNRQYPLDAVFAACERYVKATRRKLMFEYVVLRGVNDTPAQAAALAQRLRRQPLYHLNLIAYNETGGEFSRPAPGEIQALHARLERTGVSVTVRNSRAGTSRRPAGSWRWSGEGLRPEAARPGSARPRRRVPGHHGDVAAELEPRERRRPRRYLEVPVERAAELGGRRVQPEVERRPGDGRLDGGEHAAQRRSQARRVRLTEVRPGARQAPARARR